MSDARGHRGTPALQALIERAPATGALGLWMGHVDTDRDDTRAPLATDGTTLYYTRTFESLSLEAKMGWVAHAVLHVAFRHVARREALRATLGDVDDTLFNVCADALVNTTLSHLAWLQLPTGAVRAELLAERAMGQSMTADEVLLRYDVESLYRAIDDRRENTSESRRTSRDGRGDDDRGGGARRHSTTPREDERASRHGSSGGRRDGPRSATARSMAQAGQQDLLPGDDPSAPEDAEDLNRTWRERLVRGHASDGAFSLLRAVAADLPASRVPWPQVLRRYTGRALMPEPELSWSRPSRSWLANRGRTPGGRRLPMEPGVLASRLAPRLVVIVDISGSIDDGLIVRFFGHLQAITRRTRAVAVVILGDDHVRQVITGPPGRIALPPGVDGGGGTDFEPLLFEASRHRPDLTIVLTDLDGPVGPPPSFPVLWAVTGGERVQAPFGRVICVE